MKTIHLGFEVGTGESVGIPVQHTVITGQTQQAGKTTALEALVTRSRLKAVAFVTKRGEGSFAEANQIAPYFREQADWKYVASILEASRGEKMKFERSWIIKVSRGASSLADVQRNVRKALETAKGINEGVYTVLDAYLDDVVPLIERVAWAKRVTLSPGLNVVDMTALNVEMQHLVIRSTIEWVLEHEEDTVVIVPEAWKFIPQGRGTPVKLAAESFIRQAAALHNYLWLDSQDIAGVEKLILKSVPLWILGVQREWNEVKRTLAQIPAGIKKPKLEEIATLGLGEFFVCHGAHTTKVYVQPAWLSPIDARAIARGERGVYGGFGRRPAAPPPPLEEDDTVKESEARELRRNNEELAKDLETAQRENDRLMKRIEALEQVSRANGAKHPIAEIDVDIEKPKGRSPRAVALEHVANGNGGALSDEMYDAIKRRLLRDAAVLPHLLHVVTTKQEIEVEVKRQTVRADGDSWIGRVAQLYAEGFFDTPKKTGVVFTEAARRGAKGIPARADEAVKKLFAMGFLTREEDGFLAVPGMKVHVLETAER